MPVLLLTAINIEAKAVQQAGVNHVWPIGISGSRLASLPPPAPGTIVLLCGLAGALNPKLRIGDVLLDDPLELVPATVPVRRGTVHTASGAVTTPAEKAELFHHTGADAVDMEQAIVQRWCDARGAKLIGLRTIGDTAHDFIDPLVMTLVDDLGRPKIGRLTSVLVRQPQLLRGLLMLRKNTRLALDSLSLNLRPTLAFLEGQ